MKRIFNSSTLSILATALLTVILLSNCSSGGYKGEIKNPDAKKLVTTCHFITEDSIKVWVARYRNDTTGKKISQDLPGIDTLLRNNRSYNSCIVRQIINDKECIGLRVMYGLSADNKFHVILVGVKYDYSDLYVKEPQECCGGKVQAQATEALTEGKLGGAQYGQMP